MTSASGIDPALLKLAQRAGIVTPWRDAAGQSRDVSPSVLRALLDALALPCGSPAQIGDSMRQLEQGVDLADGDLVVVRSGDTPRLRSQSNGRWHLTLESGRVMTGLLKHDKPGWVSLTPVTEPGYHALVLNDCAVTLAVVPQRCSGLPVVDAGEPRPWGAVAQIYSLKEEATCRTADSRAAPSWLQGAHFGAVEKLAVAAARAGAHALAVSPAHAMFSADPSRYSPYSPSSRLFLNVCYADPVQVLGQDVVHHVLSRWHPADVNAVAARGQLLDWPLVASLRVRLLRDLFSWFQHDGSDAQIRQHEAFRRQTGSALQHHALYEALHAHHAQELGPGHGWQDWPEGLRDPSGPMAGQFARQHEEEVAFHAFAQWLAHESAQQAQVNARSAGMSCGLIADLAIGTDPRGSHAWSLQTDILTSVSVGAPPDVYQPQGQNWGLTAFSPRGLRRGAYRAFIDTLRASLRYSGGLRIDHIAGMERLWLIPDGAKADEGAYLSYPRHELLGLIALEATRHNALIIGENLGTVSDSLNRALVDYGMLGTSVLWFEREAPPSPDLKGEISAAEAMSSSLSVPSFRPARDWSPAALAMPSTHDLPTLHGWWQERDLQWKLLMQKLTRAEHKNAQDERSRERRALWQALVQDACVPNTHVDHTKTPLNAMLSLVSRTPAPLVLYSLEDLLGVVDQPNMPGGDVDQRLVNHPNWLQQLPLPVETMFSHDAVKERITTIREGRRIA